MECPHHRPASSHVIIAGEESPPPTVNGAQRKAAGIIPLGDKCRKHGVTSADAQLPPR